MEKTKETKSEAREKIAKVALQLFYSKGIRATGVDTIIGESKVAKKTFYKHFPSKQILVLEVLERIEIMWLENFHKVVDPVKDPQKRLVAVFDFLAQWFKDPSFRGCAFINTTVEAVDKQSLECVFATAHKKMLMRYLHDTALEAGFKDKSAKELSHKLLLLVDGAIVRALMEDSIDPAFTAKTVAKQIIENA